MSMRLPESCVVYGASEILAAVDHVAVAINMQCSGDDWIAMCVMNGGLMFTSEIMKRLDVPMRLDSVRVSRYHNTTSGRELRWHATPETDIRGQRVLLLDDIFDEGETLAALSRYFSVNGARQVLTAVLLEKTHDRKVEDFRPDIVGLHCEDHYVFGFGMDYEGLYRNLPEIRRLV